MTRLQQEAARALLHAEREWLKAYGWFECSPGRMTHRKAPKLKDSYVLRDAIAFTRGDPLRYGTESKLPA